MKLGYYLMCICLGAVSFGNTLSSDEVKNKSYATFIKTPDFKVKKPELVKHSGFYSQLSQDEFVDVLLYKILGKKDHGFYLEIGAGEPVLMNNTNYFERNHGWTGTSIDTQEGLDRLWYSYRKNLLLTEDATKSNYISILETFPQVVDYLSIDIDGYYDLVLHRIPFKDYVFKIITIEHDFCRFGEIYRDKERKILTALGYHLLCPDVSSGGESSEDWWVHPSAFPPSVFSKITALDLKSKDHRQIIQILHDTMIK